MTVEELIERFQKLDAQMGDQLECVVAQWDALEGELPSIAMIRGLGDAWRRSEVMCGGPPGKKAQDYRLIVEGTEAAIREMEFLAERALAVLDGKPEALKRIIDPLALRRQAEALKQLRGSALLMWCFWGTQASASGFLGDAMPPAAKWPTTSECGVDRKFVKRQWRKTKWVQPFKQSAGLLEVLDAEALRTARDARSLHSRISESLKVSQEKFRREVAEANERTERESRAAQLARSLSPSEAIDQLRAMAAIPRNQLLPAVHEGAGLIVLKMVRLGGMSGIPLARAMVLAHDGMANGPNLRSIWIDAAATVRTSKGLQKAAYVDSFSEDAQMIADIFATDGSLSSVSKLAGKRGPTKGDLATAAGISDDTMLVMLKAAGLHRGLRGAKARQERFTPEEILHLRRSVLMGNYLERTACYWKWKPWSAFDPEEHTAPPEPSRK